MENSNKIEYFCVIALQELRTKLIKKIYNKPQKQIKAIDFVQSTDNFAYVFFFVIF